MIKLLQILSIILLPILILFPIENNFITICPFFHLTSLPCPGCGLGRALLHIYHLEFTSALLFNPIAYILLLGQWYLIAGLFLPSLIEFVLKYKKTLLRVEIGVLMLFFSYGLVRIWIVMDHDVYLAHYFYDFNRTISLVKWLNIKSPANF